MKVRLVGMASAAALALAACGGSADAPRTDETTQSLLSGSSAAPSQPVPGSDQITPLPQTEVPDGPVPREERIDIAPLGRDYGSDQAPVVVLEMSDYGCGFCRRFHQQTWPMIVDEFVDSAKVQWKFVPFVTGMFPNSRVVTETAECALRQSPEAFEALNERLWSEQSVWKPSADAGALAREWAGEAGADLDRLDTCMAEGDALRRVATSTALSRQLRVRGTPTFFVLGYAPVQGALPTELFRELLTLAYEQAVAAREGG